MIMRKHNFKRITLESFSRFHNQNFADCLFKYITTECEVNDFLESQRERTYTSYIESPMDLSFFYSPYENLSIIRQRGLLECCSSNASFLRAFFKFNVDYFMVKERGILSFVKNLQKCLTYCLKQKHLESISILLSNGAIFKANHLRSALYSKDKNMIELVLSNNIWVQSEIERFSKDSPQSDLLNKTVTMCKTGFKRNCNRKQYTCSSKEPTLTGMRWEDMQKVASEMNMDYLHAIFQSSEFKEHHYRLMKIILNSKHRTLNEVIAIERILGMVDRNIVQYAFNRCELDIFRFLLLSSNIDKKGLNSMLSQAIHLNKHDHIEVLITAGGDPSPNDFVKKAGTNHNGVVHIVKFLIQSINWESKLLDNALDAATCFGTFATMKVLFEGGAKFAPNALANVSKYPLQQTSKRMFENVSEVALQWLKKLDINPPLQCNVPDKVEYVLSKHEPTSNDMSYAINHALESGSLSTIFFLRLKGGSFRRDALLAAVKRKTETLATLEFVWKTGTWSKEDLNKALDLALVLCRPTVVQYLTSEGALFNDLSLKHVLRWNVERHTHSKIIACILKSRHWSEALLNEAIQFACETSCPAVLSLFEAVRQSPTRDILFNLHDMGGQLKEKAIEHFKKRGANDDLYLLLNKNIQQGCMDVVEHLLCELQQPCDDNSLSNAMDNTGNYRNYDRLKMVRLVLESRSWSVELLMKAMAKSLRLGYTDVVFLLHDHGVTFSDRSLEYAIMDKPVGYDIYPLVMYLLERRQFSKDHINIALQMCIEQGHFKLMQMLLEKGAEFTDKGLQSAIHKNWKPFDRHLAVELVLKARQWDTTEKKAALFKAVKLGDIKVIKSLMGCGGVVSRDCLAEVLQSKCKPSHRLSLVRLLVTGSLSQDLLIDVREMARLLSEPKLVLHIQQFIV